MNSCLHKIHQFSLNDCWSKLLWHMFYNFLSYGFSYGLRPKVEVFQGRTFGYGRRWKLRLRSNTALIIRRVETLLSFLNMKVSVPKIYISIAYVIFKDSKNIVFKILRFVLRLPHNFILPWIKESLTSSWEGVMT